MLHCVEESQAASCWTNLEPHGPLPDWYSDYSPGPTPERTGEPQTEELRRDYCGHRGSYELRYDERRNVVLQSQQRW
jgi:hypothetical protein